VDVEMERGVIAISAQPFCDSCGGAKTARQITTLLSTSTAPPSTETSDTNYNHVFPQIWFLEDYMPHEDGFGVDS
jgi:hypothetical protein